MYVLRDRARAIGSKRDAYKKVKVKREIRRRISRGRPGVKRERA